jgi:fibronectin type 3 domain-containing protein
MGYTLAYANRMNLAAMTPQGNLSSTAWALANTTANANEFLVYAPNGGSFTLNLSTSTGRTLNVEWLNPATGATTAAGTVTGGSSSQSFTPPFSGDAVLYLADKGAQTPTTPTNLTATAVSSSQINLTWTASTDNVGVTGYLVERQNPGSTSFVQVGTPTGTSYNDTGLASGSTYSYRVRATDAAGNLSPYSSVVSATTPDTQPPTAPTSLSATAVSGSQINLSWTASTDNVGVTGYLVERQNPGSTSFVQVGTPTGTSYNDTGLANASTYSYRVRATDAAGNLSAYSSVASATTQAPDTQPPTAPGNLAATTVSGSQINLSWTASTDNVGVTGYLVERQNPGSTSFVQVGTPTGTSYNDTGLTPSSSYSYRVRATDAAGNLSPYSAVASATTQAANPGLVAAYSFNEGTGTTITDSSGNGNTGTIVGATWTTAGKYGGALSFNGASYVDLGNPGSLQLTGSMTLEAWVLATGTPPDDGQIIAKSDSPNTGLSGWQLKTTPDTGVETFGVAISPDGNSHVQRYSKTVRALNTWYHVAGVYNASAKTLDIYVNGVLDDGVLNGTVTASQVNPALHANIGRRSGGYYFQGTIDELRVYDVALTAAQIQADMNTPIAPVTQPPAAAPAFQAADVTSPLSTPASDTTQASLRGTITLLSFSGGVPTLSINGTAGLKYALEQTSNFVDWTSVVISNAPYLFVHSNAIGLNAEFFRTRYVP